MSDSIRMPWDKGLAGASFLSKAPVNVPAAYKDSRFNPEFDRTSGFVTRSVLCHPVLNLADEASEPPPLLFLAAQ